MLQTSKSKQQNQPTESAHSQPDHVRNLVSSSLVQAHSAFSELKFPTTEPTAKTAHVSEAPGLMATAGQWLKETASAFCHGAEKHWKALLEVRSFSDFKDWAGNVLSDTWNGVTRVAADVWKAAVTVSQELFRPRHPDAALAMRTLSEAIHEEHVAQAEKKDAEKIAAFYEQRDESKRLEERKHVREQDAAAHVSMLANGFADDMSLGNLKMAVLGNLIPPEKMPEVQRFLAESEKRKGRS